MKKTLLITTVLLLTACAVGQKTQGTSGNKQLDTSPESLSCDELRQRFDRYIDNFGYSWCEENRSVWVGATLQNVEKQYEEAYDRYTYHLTFKGAARSGTINIAEVKTNSSIPYDEGKFYRFDMTNHCQLQHSMASSGSFADPYFDRLQRMHCKRR